MKVVLTLISLNLFAAFIFADSYLKCTENELSILWPDYDNLSQYYECEDIGVPVIEICDTNTVFTFVYQSCTPQSEYIPAPPLEKLPTDAPTDVTATTPGSTSTSFTLPTPESPSGSTASTATPSTATPSTATPSTATPSTATPSTATPSTATPSTATPSTAAPTTVTPPSASTTEATTLGPPGPETPATTTGSGSDVPTPPSVGRYHPKVL